MNKSQFIFQRNKSCTKWKVHQHHFLIRICATGSDRGGRGEQGLLVEVKRQRIGLLVQIGVAGRKEPELPMGGDREWGWEEPWLLVG